jgi:GDP-L-fucose synthase
MNEDALLTGPLELTNEAYALAKIAGIKLCQAYRQQYGTNFIVGIPANVFGPGDDFSPQDSHVVAALIRKMHEAKEQRREAVELWGTGAPRREFIFADDLADACLFVMREYNEKEPINLGCGVDLSVLDLATAVKKVVGFAGRVLLDRTKPDGMPVKILDSSKLQALGWRPRTDFHSALQATYEWFLRTQRCIGHQYS